MSKIRQSDITNNSVSFSRYGTMSFTTTVLEMDGNVAITAYALGLSTGMTATQPLFIKETGTGTTGWVDQQDWTIYDITITTTIPWADVSSGSVVATTANTTLTTGDLIGIYGPSTWSYVSDLSVARESPAGVGSKNAAAVAGGWASTISEVFNGSSWLLSASLNTVCVISAGAGSQHAALVNCGNTLGVGANEIFNGAAWATTTALSSTKYSTSMAGSANAAFIAGGINASAQHMTTVELFNGSAWNSGGNLNFIKARAACFGSQNAGLLAGGSPGSLIATTNSEVFNGSTWMISANLPLYAQMNSGAGTQNAGLATMGRSTGSTTNTALFNGTVWYSSGSLNSPKHNTAALGSQSAALVASGNTNGGNDPKAESHIQNIYRKVTFNGAKEAKNLGVVTGISGSTANLKINGYISNMLVTSSNIQVTTAAQWVGKYLVLSRYSANAASTNNPPSIISKTQTDCDDLVVGYCISQTQSYIFGNNLYGLRNQTIW